MMLRFHLYVCVRVYLIQQFELILQYHEYTFHPCSYDTAACVIFFCVFFFLLLKQGWAGTVGITGQGDIHRKDFCWHTC